MKSGLFRSRAAVWAGTALALMLVAASSSDDFLEQRRKFREEIKNKIETELDAKGNYYSVIFKGEEDKYDFEMSASDKERLKAYTAEYFSCDDPALLDRLMSELGRGRFIVFKEYQDDGVNLKVIFLVPQARYWEWLTDGNGIEKMFHVYNFSVGLYEPGSDSQDVMLQTEGSFFGISQAVTLPVHFVKDAAARTYTFGMPTQAEIIKAVKDMPPVVPGRDKPEEKFIDACRTHPYFQQKDGKGGYAVSDEDILDYYRTVVTDLDEECPVKESSGHWRVQEDYPFLVVDYSLKTRVNVEALIPRPLRIGFITGTLDNVVQSISDEVSVKYLPLSMKNMRDFSQEWTRTGGPPD